jgi:hypothetical protein
MKGITMLSEDNIDKINDLIDDELRTASGAFTSHEDKQKAIERITQLKSLLSPQPTRQDILKELAAALQEQSTPATPSTADLLSEILTTFRRR